MSPPMANRSNSVDFRVMLSLTEPVLQLGYRTGASFMPLWFDFPTVIRHDFGALVAQDLSLASQRDVAALLQH